jgi:hypothetical protein
MRISLTSRLLSTAEQNLATSVFGGTLPPWSKILLNPGLGLGDRPWTDNPAGLYSLTIGPVCYPDCTSKAVWGRFGRIDAVFIHEMTHVWQYFHDYNVKLSSVWGQSFGDGYDVVLGKAWNDYNVEQEAIIVENWYVGGMTGGADEFQYVEKVVRRGGEPGASKTLAELKAWTP